MTESRPLPCPDCGDIYDACARDLPSMLAPAYRGQLARRLPAMRNAIQDGRFGPT